MQINDWFQNSGPELDGEDSGDDSDEDGDEGERRAGEDDEEEDEAFPESPVSGHLLICYIIPIQRHYL